jgi:hypothetical protein
MMRLWVIPLSGLVTGLLLSIVVLAIDRASGYDLVSETITGNPTAASSLISTIITAVVTLLSVVLEVLVLTTGTVHSWGRVRLLVKLCPLRTPDTAVVSVSRELIATTAQGPSPAPTIRWFVPAGPWTKSHWRNGRSWPSTIRSASPESTRKSSCSVSSSAASGIMLG